MACLCISLLGAFGVVWAERPPLDGPHATRHRRARPDSPAGEPVTGFEADKARALLAYLAFESDRAHPRETLAGIFWPERPEKRARASLNQALYNLRRVLGDAKAVPPFFDVTRQAIRFNPASDHWLDTAAFLALMEADEEGSSADDLAIERLGRAVSLYRGDFLQGLSLGDSPAFEEWCLLRRERLRLLLLDALQQLTAAHERLGDPDRALHWAQRWIEVDPSQEEAHLQRMRLLALSGRRSAALAQYEACRRALAEELDVEPSAGTTRLYEQIRDGGLVGSRGAQGAEKRRLHNVPAFHTPLIGREREVSEIAARLADPACRLLTLVGPGGSGKTRLAAEAAARAASSFAHGACFVPLALLRSAEEIVPIVARSLGFSSPGGTTRRQLLDFLRGAVRVYQAFRHYARRYAASAHQAGLTEAATRCADIAERPPETFAEALQLTWLVGHVYCTMLATNPTLTFGRMDELLLPFYRQDIAAGRLTREGAGDLIEDFYCKNNLILGRGEHQMSGGSDKATGWARNLTYDAPQYVVVGGRRADGSAASNDLTALFLERIVPRFENPVVVLRYTPDLPEEVWQLACARMRANASMMVYNDAKIIPAMVHCGIDPADAVSYTMHGCNWPDIPGIQRTVRTQWLVLPQILLDCLLPAEGEVRSIDDLYARFSSHVRAEAQAYCDHTRAFRATWDRKAPGLLRVDDCYLDGPVARTRSWLVGGVKYPAIVVAIAGIASVADCFCALDELVFRSGQVPLSQVVQALEDDFCGWEALRLRCTNAPKYGQDDERVDRHARRILDTVQDEIDRACGLRADGPQDAESSDQVIAFRCLETDMGHIRFGREIGATPDGRHAGQPISENTSASPGSCVNGLTAMFRSMAKLPFEKINSGALNVRVQPRLFAGGAGLARFADLLRTYVDLGGLQVQTSFVDVEELRDAQRHPERHRDLMVRITGYSAAFVDMTRQAQDEIIRREEMGCR